jgi:hypothetical protein
VTMMLVTLSLPGRRLTDLNPCCDLDMRDCEKWW